MPRPPGMYGRKPFNPEVKHLILEKFLDPRTALNRAGLPPVAITADVDRASLVPQWPMYLNDQLGDCTIAGEAHLFGALSRYGLGIEAIFGNDVIESTYSRVTGYVPGDSSTDNGALCSDVLADARDNGMVDNTNRLHKVAAYARMGNPADEVLLGQLLDVFGSVYVGFNVQASIEQEFADGQVWTYRPGEPYVGGHCVVLQRRVPAGSKHGILQYVTWGDLTWADFGWQAHNVEEAWVVVTEDWVRGNGTTVEGLDLQQLLSDMRYV